MEILQQNLERVATLHAEHIKLKATAANLESQLERKVAPTFTPSLSPSLPLAPPL